MLDSILVTIEVVEEKIRDKKKHCNSESGQRESL